MPKKQQVDLEIDNALIEQVCNHSFWGGFSESAQNHIDFESLLTYQNRYTQSQFIGEGALKSISKCYDEKTKRYVAIAQTKKGLGADADQKLLHEAWITTGLNHPNIIKIHSIDLDEKKRPFFTMDLKNNYTLTDLVTSGTSLPERIQVFIKICEAITYAHSQGVIHLDLKPDNIQCGNYGEVTVCDWGLAKRELTSEEEIDIAGHLVEVRDETLMGEIKGTLSFLAPEQVVSTGKYSAATDIYTLGCLLYFLLTDQYPYQGAKEKVLENTIKGKYIPIKQALKGRNISKSLIRIAEKALEPKPADRFHSVEQLKKDLQNYLLDLPTSIDSPNFAAKTKLFLKRHSMEVKIGGAALCSLLCWAIFYFYQAQKKDHLNNNLQTELTDLGNQNDVLVDRFLDLNDEKLIWTESAVEFVEGQISLLEAQRKSLPLDHSINDALFEYYITRMDFSKALAIPEKGISAPVARYRRFFLPYAHYSYTARTRPSTAEINSFLSHIKQDGPRKYDNAFWSNLLMKLVHYHFKAQKEIPIDERNQIAATLLNYICKEKEGVYFSYSSSKRSMKLLLSNPLPTYLYPNKFSALELLELDEASVILQQNPNRKPFGLVKLNNLNTKTLDLSQNDFIPDHKPIKINNLECLILPLQIKKEKLIEDNFRSQNPFRIDYR